MTLQIVGQLFCIFFAFVLFAFVFFAIDSYSVINWSNQKSEICYIVTKRRLFVAPNKSLYKSDGEICSNYMKRKCSDNHCTVCLLQWIKWLIGKKLVFFMASLVMRITKNGYVDVDFFSVFFIDLILGYFNIAGDWNAYLFSPFQNQLTPLYLHCYILFRCTWTSHFTQTQKHIFISQEATTSTYIVWQDFYI